MKCNDKKKMFRLLEWISIFFLIKFVKLSVGMDLPKEILNAKPRPGGAVKINEDSDISMAVLEKLLKKNANNDDSDM